MSRLAGKVAMVTGCSGERGIGRAVARRLAADGADVVLTSSGVRLAINKPTGGWGGLEAVATEVRDAGRRALTVPLDVRSAAQISEAMDRTLTEFGRLDILVNNAAAPAGADRVPVTELSEEAWDIVLDVNLKGIFLCSKAAANAMLSRKIRGRIINIGSDNSKVGQPRLAAYCASKFGLVGFSQALEHRLSGSGRHRTGGPLRAARGRHLRRSASGCPRRGVVRNHSTWSTRDPEGRGRPRGIPGVGRSGVHHGTGHQSCRRPDHALVRSGIVPGCGLASPGDRLGSEVRYSRPPRRLRNSPVR
jgi:NAD(P)-dependent dehydrogenase (short-subunit alcohol dehydrogenase family)